MLVRQGNEWLAANPDKRVLTCETVEISLCEGGSIEEEKEKVTWLEFDKGVSERFVRCLR